MIDLHWFNGNGKKQEDLLRRSVKKVPKLVDVDCLYHVKSKLKPADILYRGFRFSKLIDNELWFKEPSTILIGEVPYNRYSLKNLVFKRDTVLMNTSIDSKNDLTSNPVDLKYMNNEKYCNHGKMLRVTAFVLQFINNLKGHSKKTNSNLSTITVVPLISDPGVY